MLLAMEQIIAGALARSLLMHRGHWRGVRLLAESINSNRSVSPGYGGAYLFPFGDVGGPVAAGVAGPVDGGLDVDAEQEDASQEDEREEVAREERDRQVIAADLLCS
jgi:hypothetical protein